MVSTYHRIIADFSKCGLAQVSWTGSQRVKNGLRNLQIGFTQVKISRNIGGSGKLASPNIFLHTFFFKPRKGFPNLTTLFNFFLSDQAKEK